MGYCSQPNRYDSMIYRRCGTSGLKLPAVSLGLWHNFGGAASLSTCRELALGAFDMGITHFDLANNYGPPPGTAEEIFGQILRKDLHAHRDELIVATKAGYLMWPGPYGEWGSKKQMTASLDQSLQRLGLDYVDIFYHHRPDPDTPLEETAEALAQAVRHGKALYVGISNYSPEQTAAMVSVLGSMGIRCLIHQLRYSMLTRRDEAVLDVLEREGVGSIAYAPLDQGLLTDRYLHGIPEDSRAAGSSVFLGKDDITAESIAKARDLNAMAAARGQTLAQMALAWTLQRATSCLIGASRLQQLKDNVACLDKTDFHPDELARIEAIRTRDAAR